MSAKTAYVASVLRRPVPPTPCDRLARPVVVLRDAAAVYDYFSELLALVTAERDAANARLLAIEVAHEAALARVYALRKARSHGSDPREATKRPEGPQARISSDARTSIVRRASAKDGAGDVSPNLHARSAGGEE